MELSRRRAEAADYLLKSYNLGSERVVANWYGAANPIAGNDTAEPSHCLHSHIKPQPAYD